MSSDSELEIDENNPLVELLNQYTPSTSSENGLFSGKTIDIVLIMKCMMQNKMARVQQYVETVIVMKKMVEASEEGLKALVDAINSVMLELRNKDKWSADWDLVLVNLACNKMDVDSRREFISFAGESPSFAKLLEFAEIPMTWKPKLPSTSIVDGLYSGKFIDLPFIERNFEKIRDETSGPEIIILTQQLIDFKKLERPSFFGLRQLVNAISAVMVELITHELWSPDWNVILQHLACCKMDENTRSNWNLQYGETSDVTMLLKFTKRSMFHCIIIRKK